MKFRIMLVVLALVTPTVASALGLGKLELQSALNQPFKARVKLLSPTPDELDSLKVMLADQEAFDRAGIQRTFLLTRLRFAVQESEKGADYIQIRSNEPIREPFLNFLLEINWSKGRLFREYTVLLDPPTYSVPSSKQAVVHPQSPVVEIDSAEHQVVYDLEYQQKPEPVIKPGATTRVTPSDETPASYQQPSAVSYAGSGEYGPADTGDTLWSIASAAVQGSSVSVQQMMLAILRANPDAFIENNINGLKRGAILQIPELADSESNRAEALTEVIAQHGLWDEYKGRVASHVSEQPGATGATTQTPEPSVTGIEEADEVELRLISEPDSGTGSDQSSAKSASANIEDLNRDLALANESIEVLSLENAELKDKLTETEGIIDDLKRLIVLKEDELAAMQEQIMIAAAKQDTVAVDSIEEDAVEESAVVDDGLDEEVIDEEVAETPDEAMADEEIMIDAVMPTTGQGADGFFGLAGLLEKARANIMLVGGVAGGLLLLIILMLFASRRRSSKATTIELPTEDFPDFDEIDADETVKADADSDLDSESVTVIPGSEEETILPGDDSADEADDGFDIPDVPEEVAPVAQAAVADDVVADDEEDPMEEVNVFLAYEHFDEAEDFVKEALSREPDNLYFHSKLLEVFYAAGNKKSYEEAARVVQEKTGGQGEYWSMATVMWQEMSPNRALFEASTDDEDEEDTPDTTSSGVLNIADDAGDSETDGMDFNIDGEDSDDDILDVTAATDISSIPESGDSNELDFTLDADETLGLSDDESEELLDDTIQMQSDDIHQVQQNAEDMLDVTKAVDSEEVTATSEENELLDFSITDDVEDEENDEALDLSLDGGDEDTGDDANALDISFGEPTNEAEDDLLDVSVSRSSGSDAADELDISFGDTSGDDSSLLDDSGSLDISESSDAGNADELDISFGETSSDTEEDILDVSIADRSDDAGEADELDISFGDDSMSLDEDVAANKKSEDLLDVTSAIEFESEGDDDLMDVTSATSAGVDVDDLMSLDTDEKNVDENSTEDEFSVEMDSSDEIDLDLGESDGEADSFDFDISGDDAESADLEFEIADEANDIEIEFDAGADEEDVGKKDGDMDTTVQIATAKRDALEIEIDEDDDDDKTFLVPKSSNVNEQTEDEEIASQLDLAKAYIELGDTENAKTILDEIIAQGSEVYRKEAEELIGQIN